MLRPPHSLLVALVATTVAVTAALSWAGWRLLGQQRAIDDQRAREQLETSADAIAAGVRGKLAEAAEHLSGWLSDPASSAPTVEDAVVVAVSPDEVLVAPRDGLPFVPVVRAAPAPADVFSTIEAMEFAENQLGSSAERYRVVSRHRDARVRAGALLRLGRVLRKSGDFNSALVVYQQLSALGAVRTDDLAAELAGLDGQRAALLALGDREGERRVAVHLLQGLDSGRWLITRGAAEFYRDGLGTTSRPDSWRLADALSDLWREADGRLTARGQRVFSRDGRAVLVLWRSSESRTALLTAFAEQFFASSASGAVAWQLADPEGQPIIGASAAPTRSVARIIGNSDYPWTLHVWAASPPPAGTRTNRTIPIVMMTAMLAFVWVAAYFMARAIRREAIVARLQSDFVAAVSHEFRSPLTTVRQMAEMLEMGRLPTEERRHTYYQILAGEAARLQRLVETLLNFGRMEAGAQRYRFVDLDAATLVGEVVRDLEPQARDAGKEIEISGPDGGVRVLADESALSVALRNLIDNAIKYSPDRATVWVQCRQENDRAVICVIDHGVGIPRSEQQAVFRKFVRGRAAIDANIKGTGVGLSMVQQIVLAHGGEIRLDSEPGRGSTFTLLLPAQASDSGRPAPVVPSPQPEARSPEPGLSR
ncbi:MAG: HAMP domain-containing histidine kinase [Acidobacteria bacterium]|nr:HAMP domain-containing histidine kinase [Acidobacteriota bacterium]